MKVSTTSLTYMVMVFSYEASVALAPRSVYVEPNSMVVSLLPFSVMVGDIVSMIMLEIVRSFCDTLAAYPVEFITRMSNARLPFVSP